MSNKKKRTTSQRRDCKISQIINNYGDNCFYCGVKVEKKEITVEHLESKSKGGNNNIKNLRIAHKMCNMKAGNLDVNEKLKLRSEDTGLRGKVSSDESLFNGFIVDFNDYTEGKA